jgi:hypothetical protein
LGYCQLQEYLADLLPAAGVTHQERVGRVFAMEGGNGQLDVDFRQSKIAGLSEPCDLGGRMLGLGLVPGLA